MRLTGQAIRYLLESVASHVLFILTCTKTYVRSLSSLVFPASLSLSPPPSPSLRLLCSGTGHCYDTEDWGLLCTVTGHEAEINRAMFNPQGTRLLTCSSDKTARLWDPFTGTCLQVLEGHTDEIFSCAFNYEGTMIITGSKDNSCRLWF